MVAQDYYNRDAAKELMDRLAAGPLVAQGPTGSLLVDEAGTADVPAAFWNIAEPLALTRMHALLFVSSSGFQLRQRFFSHVARKGFRFGKGVPLSLFGFAS